MEYNNAIRVVFTTACGKKDEVFGPDSFLDVTTSMEGVFWQKESGKRYFYPWSSVDHLEYFHQETEGYRHWQDG